MISVVIPTYKRGAYLEDVNARLMAVLEPAFDTYEIIYVEDCGGDEAGQVLMLLSQCFSEVRSLCLGGNAGQQNATLAGIRAAKGDVIITLDDDLRYPPKTLLSLYDKLAEGYDVVYGIPPRQENGWIRHMGTALKEMIFYLLCHKPKGVTLTSCRAMTREMADWVGRDRVRQVYISARILQKAKRIGSVAVGSPVYDQMPTNYTLRKLVAIMIQVFRNYTRFGRKMGLSQEGPQYTIKEIHA